jgi:ribosomal protein S27AE
VTTRSAKYLQAAKDQSCVNCGAADGTVVAAHYQGMRSHSFGKGTGHKVGDLFVADLCNSCHSSFDGHQMGNHPDRLMRKIDQSEQFLFLVLKTIERRVAQGVLKL